MTATPGMTPLEVLVDEVRNALTPLLLDATGAAGGLSEHDRITLLHRMRDACNAAMTAQDVRCRACKRVVGE